jgi:hypothetical protein
VTAPDARRLGLFVAVLATAAIAVSVAYRVTDVGFPSLTSLHMFSPLVAGGIVCLANGIGSASESGARAGSSRPWRPPSRSSLSLFVSLLVPGVAFDPSADPVPGIGLPPGAMGVLVLGATVNAVFAFGEEFGWRGDLLWELAPLGFWRASVAIGAM